MKRLLPTLLGLCCIADASAQLKVQSVLPHGAAPEKTAPAVYDSTANIRTGGDAAYYESLVGQRILFYPRDIHADLRPVAYFNFLAETPAVVRFLFRLVGYISKRSVIFSLFSLSLIVAIV